MTCISKPFNATVFHTHSSPFPQFPPRLHSNVHSFFHSNTFRSTKSINISSHAVPPLPQNQIIVRSLLLSLSISPTLPLRACVVTWLSFSLQIGCGMTTVDILATVDGYPKPDDKIRTTSSKVQGGGNAGNALTCAARLGLKPKLISKVADDPRGKSILEELEADGVDTSFIVVSKGGSSTFSYVLVDSQTKTRTSIYTPGDPPLMPDDLSRSMLLSAFDGARLVYFDGMSMETALFVGQEAARNNIPILVEAESPREGLDELLKLADFVVCSAKFPLAWTQAPSIPSALVSMLIRLPNVKFVIVTLGEDGCLMLERSTNEDVGVEERNVESFLELLYKEKDDSLAIPTCISSVVRKFRSNGIGTVCGRFFIGTAEKIPDSELIDTTGAGDAFIGAIMYAICSNMVPEMMLPFAAQVAAAKCRALGARTGLPHRTDPCLACFLS